MVNLREDTHKMIMPSLFSQMELIMKETSKPQKYKAKVNSPKQSTVEPTATKGIGSMENRMGKVWKNTKMAVFIRVDL
jgi:hypothetical protein